VLVSANSIAPEGCSSFEEIARLTASPNRLCLILPSVSVHTPDALLIFLRDPQQQEAKIAIQVFASVYAFLFRHW
jgi:hypothetical protein